MQRHSFFPGHILPCLALATGILTAAETTEPYAHWDGNSLVLGNGHVERHYRLAATGLHHVSLTDLTNGAHYNQPDDTPFWGNDQDYPARNWRVSSRKLAADAVRPARLVIEVDCDYQDLTLKREFEIVAGSPAIRQTWWVRVLPEAEPNRLTQLPHATLPLDHIPLPTPHWRAHGVEFFDRTDHRDNLTRHESRSAFNRAEILRGNLFWIEPPVGAAGLFWLKEAPAAESQLDHPGHDFEFSRQHATVVGPGLALTELVPGKWYRGYGVATGVYSGGYDALRLALRRYQKTLRRYLPERDAMLMMNTWGDRNRDARISDAFLQAEVNAATRLGLSHFQIDDGWQQGLSQNSARRAGQKWEIWEDSDWKPHAERLPNGLHPISAYAANRRMALGLWFNPTRADSYATWQRDAAIVLDLHHSYGVRYFKIDGMELPDKAADDHFRRFCEHLIDQSAGNIVLHLDATAGRRLGYHYLNHFGVTFLENRYTDWGNYYPHSTLRNLWMLAHYVPPERLQIEFLNLWRNADAYSPNDPLAPANIPFDYAFALTMMAQPLAWFEATGLPEEAFAIAPLVQRYRKLQPEIHSGLILPIGQEPDGYQWTGFQSTVDDDHGFLLILRENHPEAEQSVRCLFPSGRTVELESIWPEAGNRTIIVGEDQTLDFSLPQPFSFQLWSYRLTQEARRRPDR